MFPNPIRWTRTWYSSPEDQISASTVKVHGRRLNPKASCGRFPFFRGKHSTVHRLSNSKISWDWLLILAAVLSSAWFHSAKLNWGNNQLALTSSKVWRFSESPQQDSNSLTLSFTNWASKFSPNDSSEVKSIDHPFFPFWWACLLVLLDLVQEK